MANLAAILPTAKAPLEVREVEVYKPGPTELLLKNEVIAFNPVEYKIAKFGIFPLQYPYVLGSTSAGTVEAVGAEIKNFQEGDRVVISRKSMMAGNQYGAYQRYTIVADGMISKIPDSVELAVPASVMGNICCVVGLFTGRLGLDRPRLDEVLPKDKGQKILIYGGSSSFGSLSVQYLSRAGYNVVSTTSPKNEKFVSGLGATKLFDHTMEPDKLVEKLVAEGPYDVVVDVISQPNTIPLVARVLAHQGGGKLYAVQPAFAPEALPEGVARAFESWSDPLFEKNNAGVLEWLLQTYIPQGLTAGAIKTLPVEKVSGGLRAANDALNRMQQGISGVRLVVDPWE